jgi:hypothetical protein
MDPLTLVLAVAGVLTLIVIITLLLAARSAQGLG